MDTEFQEQVVFHLTGLPSDHGLEPVDRLSLRPALFARYPDLAALRYDYPVVLVVDAADAAHVVSLSGLFDAIMDGLASESGHLDAGRIRHHGVRLEREIRRLSADGGGGRLSALWATAEACLSESGEEGLAGSLAQLEAARPVDGEVVECDGDAAERVLAHVWQREQAIKVKRLRREIDRLALGLAGILRAEWVNSPAGMSAEALSGSFGDGFGAEIDFGVMSNVLTAARPVAPLPEARRARIEGLLTTLEAQRFFASGDPAAADPAADAYGYRFESCAEAVAAYRRRLPEMTELAKAVRMAGLEVDGAYRPEAHDRVFEAVGAAGLDPAELDVFPDYLVVTRSASLDAPERAKLVEALSVGLPMKVLLLVDDLPGAPRRDNGDVPAGATARRLCNAAIGIGGVHVVQSTSSHLYRMRDSLARGVTADGPALFAVFTGAGGATGDLPPYLVAAAAVESRAFPVVAYEPAAGPDWASRMTLEHNPQPERDWPIHVQAAEDDDLQRVVDDLAFTLVDFLACDARYTARLARVPRDRWNDKMVPVVDRVEAAADGFPEKVPFVFMVDADGGVHKALVERRLVQETRRCRDQWRSLQELGGIHNSFAERLLAREREAWEERLLEAEASRQADGAYAMPVAPIGDAESAAGADEQAPPVPTRDPDVPMIETTRCSTCDECTKLNNRMFKYNGNKQAYIADISAGTYADMVLAAERCQVAVIHPGKPWDPEEPGLAALLERAAPFR